MTDGALHHEIHGEGGDPVLLVMGFAMSGEMWGPVVPALAARHRVATFDHRGLGRSPDPARTSMAELADDARSVLDALGWDRAHVVGISMGGMIAQELALACPDRIRTLSLIATHAGGALGALPPMAGIAAMLTPTSRADRLERLLYPSEVRSRFRDRTNAQLAIRQGPGTRSAHLRAVRTHDTRDPPRPDRRPHPRRQARPRPPLPPHPQRHAGPRHPERKPAHPAARRPRHRRPGSRRAHRSVARALFIEACAGMRCARRSRATLRSPIGVARTLSAAGDTESVGDVTRPSPARARVDRVRHAATAPAIVRAAA